jgi:hypothetical protein
MNGSGLHVVRRRSIAGAASRMRSSALLRAADRTEHVGRLERLPAKGDPRCTAPLPHSASSWCGRWPGNGFAHGGIVSYAADNAITFAVGSVAGPDVLTSGIHGNYLAGARGDLLEAGATVVDKGRRLVTVRCATSSTTGRSSAPVTRSPRAPSCGQPGRPQKPAKHREKALPD